MTPHDVGRAATALWRTYGTSGGWRRASFEARRVAGRFRVTPRAAPPRVGATTLPPSWPFRPDARRVADGTDRDEALARAERVLAGEHQAYRWSWLRRPMAPREWRVHPTTGYEYDASAPWFRIAHVNAAAGDIKDVWEPARFAWAYDLARGWMLTGADRFARAFWTGLETFLEGCPPFRGVQWSCGQETAVRAMAWLWAESAFAEAPSTTAERRTKLWQALAWSAERIEDAIGYALSQRNNHGISEAAGLVAVGARLRARDPRAARWLRRGRWWLEQQMRDQFTEDGWYVQHSFNYARVALDQLVLAERALRSAARGLSANAVRLVRAGVRLLAGVVEPATGAPPLHGANDGAYVLPLSTRPFQDFVPALTAAAATFGEPLPAALTPDAETLAWLSADPPAVDEDAAPPTVRVGPSGWASVATVGARVFARAGRYRSRPGHIDPLHVDISLEGRPVATDAGTYRYAAPPPWANALAAEEVHNTLTIPGRPIARRGPRFLWLNWPRAQVRAVERRGDAVKLVLENESWSEAGIRHTRTCEVGARGVLVVDEVVAPPTETFPVCVHWLLDGDAAEIAIASDSEISVESRLGTEDSPLGWISESYGVRRHATSVRIWGRPEQGRIRIATGFGSCRSAELLRARLANAGAVAACST